MCAFTKERISNCSNYNRSERTSGLLGSDPRTEVHAGRWAALVMMRVLILLTGVGVMHAANADTATGGAASVAAPGAPAAIRMPQRDPDEWLSQIRSARALAWVMRQNARSDAALKSDPHYARDRARILSALNAGGRIPTGSLHYPWVFNFWQGAGHAHGLWRRTTIVDYARPSPHWQTLLDLDRLDRQTHRDWVWAGADCAPSLRRCLVSLSPAGGDAVVIREYDLAQRRFLDHGFSVPLAKATAVYLDDNSILLATDFGPDSLTSASYPRLVKLWRRGTPLSGATIVLSGRPNDVQVAPQVFRGPYGTVALLLRQPSFFQTDYFLLRADDSTVRLPLPPDAQVQGVTHDQIVATLQDDWNRGGHLFPAGALIALDATQLLRDDRSDGADEGGGGAAVTLLYAPGAHAMIDEVSAGRDAVYASIYENVTGSIHAFRLVRGAWTDERLALPRGGSVSIDSTDDWGAQAYFRFAGFLNPPTLFAYAGAAPPQAIRAQPARFDARALAVRQYWARSADGTRVPYFFVGPRTPSGPIPTILYGYGGFQVSLTPWYWDDPHRPLDAGEIWLSRGGGIAVANIRGGGEFGPAWHQAALTDHRQRAFDDFEAVAADIEQRGLSSAQRLGILGASNGGLLVSTAMVQQPSLFGAVVCQRPLIDMLRYTQFGAGASWIAEYGDPADPKMAAYLRGYSPYQNVRPGAAYPPVLFITETSDDRVTPVFARLMAAKMQAQGHYVLFHESTEGGHGAGSTPAQQADYWALSYVFLARQLHLGR